MYDAQPAVRCLCVQDAAMLLASLVTIEMWYGTP